MSDLFDELADSADQQAVDAIRNVGGDLFDELDAKPGGPATLSPARADQAVSDARQQSTQQLNDELSLLDTARVGIGRGITTIGRAVGLAAPEDPATARNFAELTSRAPIPTRIPLPSGSSLNINANPQATIAAGGEIVGEAVPFLPLGVGAGAIRAILPRIFANIGLGALEGGAITKGRGGSANEQILGAGIGGIAAGTFEAAIPVIGRIAGALFRRLKRSSPPSLLTTEGVPTPEFQAALDESGTKFEDIVAEAFTTVNASGGDVGQAGRIARFKSQDIPATSGDITQGFAQQAKEQRLAVSATGDLGEPIRQVRLKQSEAFKTRVGELVDSLGMPDDAGRSLKEALTSRRDLLKKEKNSLYDQVFNANPEIKNVPLFTNSIEDAVPTTEILDDLAITAGDRVGELETALVRFGISTDEAAVKAFEKGGMHAKPGVVTPLTVGNFDRFRKILGNIERNDSSGAIKVATGPIKRALDKEADLIGTHVKAAGFDDVGILDTLKAARSRVRTLKTEFSKDSIAGRLIGLKRDGFTPIVEASRAANEVLKPTAPIEVLQRTMKSLIQSGPGGKQAIQNMRAAVVLNALEDALKSTTRKINNTQIVGGAQFVNSLRKFGDDKLDVLFAGNKPALAKLRNLKQTAFDIEASAGAVPRGSAAVNQDIAMSILRSSGVLASGLGAIGAMLKTVVRPALDSRGVRKAVLNVTPETKRVISAFEREFPALASTLGIAAVVSAADKDQQP